jgi:hypothetical protein
VSRRPPWLGWAILASAVAGIALGIWLFGLVTSTGG